MRSVAFIIRLQPDTLTSAEPSLITLACNARQSALNADQAGAGVGPYAW